MKFRTMLCSTGALLLAAVALHGDEPGTRKLRFVQDDAQDYMVSKIYH